MVLRPPAPGPGARLMLLMRLHQASWLQERPCVGHNILRDTLWLGPSATMATKVCWQGGAFTRRLGGLCIISCGERTMVLSEHLTPIPVSLCRRNPVKFLKSQQGLGPLEVSFERKQYKRAIFSCYSFPRAGSLLYIQKVSLGGRDGQDP